MAILTQQTSGNTMQALQNLFDSANSSVANLAPFIPLLILVVAYYFLIARPQQKAQADFEKMLEEIVINQRLITRGGMIGVVVEILPTSFILEVYDGTKIEILKEAIVTILYE